jgi:hypothetical protein
MGTYMSESTNSTAMGDGLPELNSAYYNKDYFDGGKGYFLYEDAGHFRDTAEWLVREFQPQTVLEIGCAKGFLVKALRDLGVKAYGCDISEYALNISSEHQRDLTDSSSARFYTSSFALVASMAKRLNDVMSKIEVDEEAMQRNLYLTKGAIAAEPLYLLLEKYGHTTAHEASKALAHEAMERNVSLYEVASQAENIASYWAKFTEKERELIHSPETHYTGLAAQKTRAIIQP